MEGLKITFKLPQKKETSPSPQQQHHFTNDENKTIEVEVKRILQKMKREHVTFRSERDKSPLNPTGTTYWQKYLDTYGEGGFEPSVWALLLTITQKARKLGRAVSNMVRKKKGGVFLFSHIRFFDLDSSKGNYIGRFISGRR
jgi:hypothetical protein